ncbi:MAG: ankyrin repeat domain-containing protein [Nitrosomonas sp.]|nr:ankyrin repeat domain-containing protein [Nitrosomonas sp.]
MPHIVKYIFLLLLLSSQSVSAIRADDPTLLDAIRSSSAERTINLLDRLTSEEINYPVTSNGETLLHLAVTSKNSSDKTKIINRLLALGADINRRNNAGRLPIHLSVRAHEDPALETFEILVQNKADVNSLDTNKNNIAHLIMDYVKPDVLQRLIEKGVDINKANAQGETPLLIAASKGNEQNVNVLIENNANVNATDRGGNGLIHKAALIGNIRIIDLGIKHGINIDLENRNKETALSLLAARAQWSQVRILLNQGANPNVLIPGQNTTVALHLLTNPEIGLSDLIDKSKIDPNIKSGQKATLLFTALSRVDYENIKLLIELGADPNETNAPNYPVIPLLAGKDPLRYPDLLQVIEFMIKQGAHINAQQMGVGKTGLMIAAENGYADVVKLLIKHRADVNLIAGQGRGGFKETALGSSLLENKYHIAQILINAGATIIQDDISYWLKISQMLEALLKQQDRETAILILNILKSLHSNVIKISQNTLTTPFFSSAYKQMKESENDEVRSIVKKMHFVDIKTGKNLDDLTGIWETSLRAAQLRAEQSPSNQAPVKVESTTTVRKASCKLDTSSFPKNFMIYAGGAYRGKETDYQIDQSGHTATQFEVVVNSPNIPVALLLGAYEPSVWNIKWTSGTVILGVFVTGYHAQRISGIADNMPVVNSSYQEGFSCGYAYVKEDNASEINSLSNIVFGKSADLVYVAKNGELQIGETLPSSVRLHTSKNNPPEKHLDASMPKAGQAGINDALAKGILRPLRKDDIELWATEKAKLYKDHPKIVGGDRLAAFKPKIHGNAYVILKEFTIPSGLYGAHSVTFFLQKRVTYPTGKLGHSKLYDFNNLGCIGATCEHL